MNIVTRKVLYGLLFTVVLAQISSGQNSPCENVFKYRFNGLEWFGVVVVDNPPQDTNIDAMVALTLSRPLPSQYVGKLELMRTVQESVNILRRDNQIVYRVLFPIQDPRPQLRYIRINGQTICQGNPTHTPYTLTITLHHQLKLSGALPIRHSDSSNINRPVVTEPPEVATFRPLSAATRPPVQQPTTLNPNTNTNIGTAVPSSSQYINRFLDNCGRPNNQIPLVHGGREPARDQYLWLSSIYTSSSGGVNFTCGGSLITEKHVLTAAHCIRKDRQAIPILPEKIVVMVGRFDITNWDQTGVFSTNVDHYYIHPQYLTHTHKYNDDIAILVFRNPIDFTQFSHIRPVCLWTMPNDLTSIVGTEGTVVGWGRDETGRKTTPTPRELNVPIVSQSDCFLTDLRELSTNSTLCAGSRDGKGPCTGDSGGGLYMWVGGRYYLRGIVSIALQDENRSCNLREFSIYTDVAKYIPWIEETVERN